ncbi:MAG TPA: acyl-CoA dehydrogenase [Acidimicrobiia bacterium]|nr:acyl-CoA dehydrogenase [Acidimicrobiia bacterium]
MSHYRSNLEDIEFILFEVLGVGEHLDLFDFDVDTASSVLAEVERLATNEWAASFVDADRTPLELVDGTVVLPESVKASLAAFRDGGWDRFGLPVELGGTPVPPTLLWAAQELLLGANPTAMFYGGSALFARVLFHEGTEEQKELARLMVENGWGGSMVLTEPDAGSDVGAAVTKAIHVEGDTYHIEGVKRFITAAEHDAADNIVHLVLARPEGARPGTKGLSMFAVPKVLVNDDGSLGERNGVVATNIEKKMGIKGSTTCELTFGADRPAVGFLVGGVHDGIRQMFRVIENARMTIGMKSAATLSTGYLNALAYARERHQGTDLARAADKTAPRVPIIAHPDVRRMLITQKAYAEGLRALALYAAWCQEMAVLEPENDEWERRSDFLLPLVKGYSSEKAYELLAMSLQVFGGSGYIQDYPIEQYIRDAKIDTVYEGTTGIQAMDLFFRKIARDQGRTVSALSQDIAALVKGTHDGDGISAERETLGRMLADVQSHVGTMVAEGMAAMAGEPERVYRVGLHANALLESMAELVIGWQLLRQVEVLGDRVDDFALGKRAAVSFYLADVEPKIRARAARAAAEDGSLMDLPDGAW